MSAAEFEFKLPQARGTDPAFTDGGFYCPSFGIADFRPEHARAANFRHKLNACGGRAARLPEGHTAVVHGADQRRKMCAARNRDGCTAGGPVACKRYIVGGGGLRMHRIQSHAEGDGGKEEKTHSDPCGTAKNAGETQKTGASPHADTVPARLSVRARWSVWL